METLIVALNSKYIHSALAPWYLKASCGRECGTVRVLERTINEYAEDILAAIYGYKPDVTAFSCYIWNIRMVLELVSDLKKLLPQSIIVLGGPEVSYDAGELLKKHEQIDYIIAGEGEKSFPQLLARLAENKASEGEPPEGCILERGDASAFAWAGNTGLAPTGGLNSINNLNSIGKLNSIGGLKSIEGLSCRSASGIVNSPPAFVIDLDSIPSPYTDEMLSSLKNRIAYFEASRGCPFSCSYCLSSVSEGVRTFSPERIFSDLERLVGSGVSQVKFVDRTFNANRERAKLILKHIIETYGSTACNFHFEVGADLFGDEIMSILENAPKGLIQIEAGVQSTNEKALAAVCRKTNTTRLLDNIRRLASTGNVHIHADLIAGLPYEDYGSFARSFDRVYAAGPHQLQLGFLKFLKGTRLRRETDSEGDGEGYREADPEGGGKTDACPHTTEAHPRTADAQPHSAGAQTHTTDAHPRTADAGGYIYRDTPPYEILSGGYLDYEELAKLKGIAGLVDKYYNSTRFAYSLDYLINKDFGSPFSFFENFQEFYEKSGFLTNPAALREYYAVLERFAAGRLDEDGRSMFRELLRLDFLASDNTGTLPAFFENRGSGRLQDKCFEFLRDSGKMAGLIPEAAGLTPKQSIKKVHFECFHLIASGAVNGLGGNNGSYLISNTACQNNSFSYDPGADTIFLFNYISRDKVTGRYPFHVTDIRLS